MIIGIDIDGVIYQTENLFREYSEQFNKLIGGKVIKADELKISDRYDWGKEQVNKFIKDFYYEIKKNAPLYPKAQEIIQKLKKDNQIVFITSRGIIDNSEVDLTLERLSLDKIPYDKIIFNQKSKLKACKEFGVDLMIDDYYKVVDELNENGVNCLYFRDKRNKTSQSNALEVYSWNEIDCLIDEISKELC